MRSDEYYTDIEDFIKHCYQHTDKMVTSNIFFRKPELFRLHPSDHIIFGETKKLLSTFENCQSECLDSNVNKITSKYKYLIKNESLVPEQQIAINWLLVNKKIMSEKELSDDDIIQLTKENFEIFPIENMGYYSVSCHGEYKISPDMFFNEDMDIKSMDELVIIGKNDSVNKSSN